MATFPHIFLSYPDAGGSYTFTNTEASDLVAAMVSAPDDTRKGAIDTLVGALKSAGVWTLLDGLWVYAAHTSQAALLNWKAPAGTASTLVNSPVFTANQGFAGNGTNSYVNTQFVPSTNGVQLTTNSASFTLWSRTAGQVNAVCGSTTATAGLVLNPRTTSNLLNCWVNNRVTTTFATVTNGIGMFSAIRTDASTVVGYQNGAAVGTPVTGASVGRPDRTIFIGAYNNQGTAAQFHNRQYALAAVGGARTAQQELDFYNAVAAYMTAVGA